MATTKTRIDLAAARLDERDGGVPDTQDAEEWDRLVRAFTALLVWCYEHGSDPEVEALEKFLLTRNTGGVVAFDDPGLLLAADLQRRAPADLVDAVVSRRTWYGSRTSEFYEVLPVGYAAGAAGAAWSDAARAGDLDRRRAASVVLVRVGAQGRM